MSNWISVKDRLPEPFISVLIYIPEDKPLPTVNEGFMSDDGTWMVLYGYAVPVTHWMELPKPPKEDE